MSAIASAPGAARVFAISIVARLPLTMLSIGLLVHARHLTGSFAAAGVVTGAYAVALGAGGPLLGKLVDRRGQTLVLVASAGVAAPLLGVVAVLPTGSPVGVLVALASAIGLASPPIGACVRTLFPGLLPDPGAVRAAYTAHPASRAWRPAPAETARSRGGSLRTPAMRTLIVVLVAVGVLFGAVEVAVTAATSALGSTAAAGPLLGVWGTGSLVGGLLSTRFGEKVHGAAGLTLVLVALTAGHLLLIPAAGSVLALAAVLLVAGAAIAPTYATAYAMVDAAAPAGTVTEAFAWLATAIAIGASAGSAAAGALADHAGPVAAFALAIAAGAAAVVLAMALSSTLPGRA